MILRLQAEHFLGIDLSSALNHQSAFSFLYVPARHALKTFSQKFNKKTGNYSVEELRRYYGAFALYAYNSKKYEENQSNHCKYYLEHPALSHVFIAIEHIARNVKSRNVKLERSVIQ